MIRTKAKLDAGKVDKLVRELEADPDAHATKVSPRFDNAANLVAHLHKPTLSRGRPSSGKIVVSLRLDPAVIQRFKDTGPGWQSRINETLKTAKIPPA